MSQTLRIFTDTHIAFAIVKQLRLRGIDVERCEDVGLAEAKDEELLIYATNHQRAILSFDSDFDVLHKKWLENSKPHCGIFRCSSNLQGAKGIGAIIVFLEVYHLAVSQGAGSLEKDVYNEFILVS